MKKGQGISEQAVQRLEDTGYLMNVRAEMKDEVMKCLVEMQEQNEIPSHLRIKQYTPQDDENAQALAYVAEFLRFHNLEHTLNCLKAEVNGDIMGIRSNGQQSQLATAIMMKESQGADLFE